MIAIIRTGGKQYKVSPGDKIKIEKLDEPSLLKITEGKKEGAQISFDEVLLLEKNKKTQIGAPLVVGAKVIGKILKQDRSRKVIVFKYKPKKRYKVKKGHRQPYTEVEIVKILNTKI